MITPPDQPTRPTQGLVLGGGGVAGIAWMTGLFLGLEERGVQVSPLDGVIGTSAGAAVAGQITSGNPLADLFERQVRPERQVAELVPKIRYLRLFARLLPAFPLFFRKDPRALRAYVGRIALDTESVDPASRLAVIKARLPRDEWPDVPVRIVAIDAMSGELRCFDRDSGVGLVEAVAASCAVPGVWPPVRIQHRAYIDGGAPSPNNVALASGMGSVMIVSPMGGAKSGGLGKRLSREVSALESTGGRTFVVVPDPRSRAAIGRNALDPSRRSAAANAGRSQGQAVAANLEEWLAASRSSSQGHA